MATEEQRDVVQRRLGRGVALLQHVLPAFATGVAGWIVVLTRTQRYRTTIANAVSTEWRFRATSWR